MSDEMLPIRPRVLAEGAYPTEGTSFHGAYDGKEGASSDEQARWSSDDVLLRYPICREVVRELIQRGWTTGLGGEPKIATGRSASPLDNPPSWTAIEVSLT